MRSSTRSWPRLPGRRIAILAAALAGVVAVAACGTPGRPTVSDAWVRATAAGADSSAAYLVITNPGPADALVRASSTSADAVTLHQTTTDPSGMTEMGTLDVIGVPAGGTVKLEPGGLHLMIMGLHEPLVAGASVEIDLVFEHAGTVVVQAAIRTT
jgi:periplasmic copper chaperone A